jgi:hypothetical protein
MRLKPARSGDDAGNASARAEVIKRTCKIASGEMSLR